jgi:hypothetical protein
VDAPNPQGHSTNHTNENNSNRLLIPQFIVYHKTTAVTRLTPILDDYNHSPQQRQYNSCGFLLFSSNQFHKQVDNIVFGMEFHFPQILREKSGIFRPASLFSSPRQETTTRGESRLSPNGSALCTASARFVNPFLGFLRGCRRKTRGRE